MTEEIVIKTETVKVDELQGREKTIYDFAYKKGLSDALDENNHIIARTIAKSAAFIAFVCFIAIILKSCAY